MITVKQIEQETGDCILGALTGKYFFLTKDERPDSIPKLAEELDKLEVAIRDRARTLNPAYGA